MQPNTILRPLPSVLRLLLSVCVFAWAPLGALCAAVPTPAFTTLSANPNGTLRGPTNFFSTNNVLQTPRHTTMAALASAAAPAHFTRVRLDACASTEDGGGGWFTYHSSGALATLTTNLGMVIAPAAGTGRYVRDFDPVINARWFGARGDGTNDDTAAIQAAIDFASAPSYGWPAGSGLTTKLSVYLPPGKYRTTSPILIKGVELFGRHGGGDWTANTWLLSDHAGDCLVVNYGDSTAAPRLHDFHLYSQDRTYITTKAITAVASRTNFTVAIGDLPTHTPRSIWPYYGFASFYDDQANWLGCAPVQSINTGTGQVTLATDWDNYATVSSSGGLLRTVDRVVFPASVTEGGITVPDSSQSRGINLKNTSAGAAFFPWIERVHIVGFHTGIRLGLRGLSGRFRDLTINARFAAVYCPDAQYVTDNFWDGIFISGGKVDYLPFTNSYLDGGYRYMAFGVYGCSPLEKWGTLLVDQAVVGVYVDQTLQQQLGVVQLDNIVRYGWCLHRGYNTGGDPYSKVCTVGSLSVRPGLASTHYQSRHTDTSALRVFGTASSNPAICAIGDYVVAKGYTNFAAAFHTYPNAGHKILVNRLSDSAGADAHCLTGDEWPLIAASHLITTPEVAGSGWYWPSTNRVAFASAGTKVLDIGPGSTSLTYGGLDVATASTNGLTVMNADGLSVLNLKRNSPDQTWSMDVLGSALVAKNTTAGVRGMMLYSATNLLQLYLGEAGSTGTPRDTSLYAEFAASAAGTNVAAGSTLILTSRGTGNSTTGGDAIVYTPDAGASGTSPQGVSVKFRFKREGALNFTPRATAPTVNVSDGDVYYDAVLGKLRVRAAGVWVDLH